MQVFKAIKKLKWCLGLKMHQYSQNLPACKIGCFGNFEIKKANPFLSCIPRSCVTQPREITSKCLAYPLEVASVPFPTLFPPFSLPGKGLPLPLSLPPGLKRVVRRIAGASSWRFLGHSIRIFFRNAFQFPFPINFHLILDPKIHPKATTNLSQIHNSCHSNFNFNFQLIFDNFSCQAYTYRTLKILRIICVLQCFCKISIFLTMILSSSRPIPKMLHVRFQNLQKSTLQPIEIGID